jgi:hypothetical protein
MRQEVSRRLTVLAKDGRSPGESMTNVLVKVKANSPGESKTNVLVKDGDFQQKLN